MGHPDITEMVNWAWNSKLFGYILTGIQNRLCVFPVLFIRLHSFHAAKHLCEVVKNCVTLSVDTLDLQEISSETSERWKDFKLRSCWFLSEVCSTSCITHVVHCVFMCVNVGFIWLNWTFKNKNKIICAVRSCCVCYGKRLLTKKRCAAKW